MSPANTILAICGCIFVGTLLFLRAAPAGLREIERTATEWVRTRLEDAFVFVDPTFWVRLAIAAVLSVPVLAGWLAGPGLAVLVSILMLAAPFIVFATRKRKRSAMLVVQLPDMLAVLSSSLRAGTSLKVSVDMAVRETPAPLSQELAVIAREQRLGLALEDALETMATRLKMEEFDLLVSAVTIARECGGNLAETLDQLARTLRAKAAMEGKIRSLTSQGKLQGWIVGALPLVLMAVLTYMQPESMHPLYHTGIGYCVLGAIALLETWGFFWIRKIVRIDV
jgi:tight adherence protein B